MTRLRLSAALLLTIFVAFGATACDTITGGDDDITGTYTLKTYNGESLPYVVYEDDQSKYEILGGTLTLNEHNSCSLTSSGQETYKPDNTTQDDNETDICMYWVTDATIRITVEDEGGEGVDVVVTGTISGDTITLAGGDVTLVFEK